MNNHTINDTICALSTAPGVGAIAVIRVSGSKAISIADKVFSKSLKKAKSHTAHFGRIIDDARLVDEVVVVLFKGPESFTGEDTVEFSCHGSVFIQSEILRLLREEGCRMAKPGEFTMRAFLNQKMDLSQAEAVADLIAAESSGAHQLAMHQMRGGFSKEIGVLREKLIHFASLIELELDFAEEDVEFADRDAFNELLDELQVLLTKLIDSFQAGNVIKNGVPVAIVGAPNQGKSTLLNALLKEERAIVSEIAGTTRDTIEDELVVDGLRFRFIDTAGLRETKDHIESLGIERAMDKARGANIILLLIDAGLIINPEELKAHIDGFLKDLDTAAARVILVANKVDRRVDEWETLQPALDVIVNGYEQIQSGVLISALDGTNMEGLQSELSHQVNLGVNIGQDVIVSNARHHEALSNALESLVLVKKGLNTGITGDFLASDIRKSLHHLGEITGQITTDDLLGNIFGKFCIGK